MIGNSVYYFQEYLAETFLREISVIVEFPASTLGTETEEDKYGSLGNFSGKDKICSSKPFFFSTIFKCLFG